VPRPLLSALTWADVVVMAPQLSAASAPLQSLVLAMVQARLGQDAFGDLAFDAGLFLAAHLGVVATQGAAGAGGPIASKAAGPVSVSYGIPSDWESGLQLTAYGREFLRLRRSALGFVGFVV
jgi:FAD/FMN-containing dehydrogenase